MKQQSQWIIKILIFIFSVFIILFMGGHLIATLNDPVTTVTAVLTTSIESIPVSGVVVRDEKTFPLPNNPVEFLAFEGERVSAGQVVATSFPSESARLHNAELVSKTQQLELLNHIAGFGANTLDSVSFGEELRISSAELLGDISRGDFSALPKRTADIKALIFHQAHMFDGLDILRPRIEALNLEIENISSELSGLSEPLTVESSGLFSSNSDGLEDFWEPEVLRNISVAGFSEKTSHAAETFRNYGRIINNWTWRFVAILPSFEAQNLRGSATVRFAGGNTLTFNVEYVSPEDNGERVVVLQTDRYISRFLSERRLNGELILGEYRGVRIPWEGLRVDAETGEYFVYCLLLGRIVRRYVDLVYHLERDNYYLAIHNPDSAVALLPGDEIIIAGRGLYHGRVLER